MSPRHDCPRSGPAGLETQIHESQAGDARHRCFACAYLAGFDGGTQAVTDKRRASWPAVDCERCIEGHAAPRSDLLDLPRNQGEGRHLCAICAWVKGWRDGVDSLR